MKPSIHHRATKLMSSNRADAGLMIVTAQLLLLQHDYYKVVWPAGKPPSY